MTHKSKLDSIDVVKKLFSKKILLWVTGGVAALVAVLIIISVSLIFINNKNIAAEHETYESFSAQYVSRKNRWGALQQEALALLSSTKGKVETPSLWNALNETAKFELPEIKKPSHNTVSSLNAATSELKKEINVVNTQISLLSLQMENVYQSYTSYAAANKNASLFSPNEPQPQRPIGIYLSVIVSPPPVKVEPPVFVTPTEPTRPTVPKQSNSKS